MKKEITLFLLLICVLIFQNIDAQNSTLSLPPIYSVPSGSVTTLPTVSGGYSGAISEGPSNIYPGADGKPLIFTSTETNLDIPYLPAITTTLYNKNGHKIGQLLQTYNDPHPSNLGDPTLGGVISNNELAIAPDPGNCKQFYVIGTAENFELPNQCGYTYDEFSYYPFFALVDMSQQTPNAPAGELGKIVSPGASATHNIVNLYNLVPDQTLFTTYSLRPSNRSAKIALSKINPADNSRFLFVFNDQFLYTFKITASGIQYLQSNLISGAAGTALFTSGGATCGIVFGEMEIYEENNLIKFAVPISRTTGSGLIYDTNPFLGLFEMNVGGTMPYPVSNPKNVCVSQCSGTISSQIAGVEFSPDGKFVYFTHEPIANSIPSVNNPVEWVEFNNINNRGALTPSGVTMTDFKYSQIEKGLDGKLYFATSNRLATINNANSPNAVVWNNNAVGLANYPLFLNDYTISLPIQLGGYLLPDQIDQETYGGFYNETQVCCRTYNDFTIEKEFTFPVGTYTVSPGSQIIGTDSYTQSYTVTFSAINPTTTKANLHIPAGANVTFKDLRIEFMPEYLPLVPNDPNDPYIPGAKLIVHQSASPTSGQGGKLTLNNCTLTVCTRCSNDRMWPGVEVWGYNAPAVGSTHQGTFVNSVQGWMRFNPNSKIEHAINGLTIGDVNGGQGGGVVEGNSATIENCVRGLLMYPSGNITANKTKFNRCNFQNTHALIDPTKYPFTLARVDDGINVYFYGCSFKNTHAPYDQGYYGLKSNSSLLHVLSSGLVNTSFERLSYGIHATSIHQGPSIECQKATFNSNRIGAFLSTVDYATFKTNTFKMVDNKGSNSYFSVGIVLDASTRFDISSNNFSNKTASIATNPTIGILVRNSNVNEANDNIIEKNTFTKLHFGIQAIDRNYTNYVANNNISNDGGLQYFCNSFTAPIVWADIATSKTPGIASGINYHQGYNTQSGIPYTTANTYSNTFLNVVNDIYQDDDAFSVISFWSDNIVRGEPKTVSPNVFKVYSASTSNGCSNSPFNLTINNIYNEVDGKVLEANQKAAEIQEILDKGSNPALLQLINNGNSAGNIKQTLKEASPLLTPEILLAYLNSSAPNGHKKEVLKECSPLTTEVMSAVEASTLPNGIKKEIRSEQNGTARYTLATDKVKMYNSQIDWLYSEVIRTYLHDSDYLGSYQKALEYIKLSFKPSVCKGKECRYDITTKDGASALENLQLLQSVLSAGTPKLEISEKLYYLYGKDIKAELDQNPTLKAELEAIAVNTQDKEAAALAIGVLNFLNEREVPIEFMGMNAASTARVSVAAMKEIQDEYMEGEFVTSISNFPNPFTGKTTLTTTVPDFTSSAELVVIDVLGKEVARYTLQVGENAVTFDNENLSGILYYSLFVNGKRKATKMMLKQ